MRQIRFQRALPVIASVLVAATMLTAGCGRTPVNPADPGGEPGSEEPAPDEPGEEPIPDLPFPVDPVQPAPGGGGVAPAPGPKPPSAPVSALRPLPRPTATPKAAPPPAPPPPVDHQAVMEAFVAQLADFGYEASGRTDGVHNVRMQLLPLTRVARFDWWRGTPGGADWVGLTYGRRKGSFPRPPATMEAWMAEGKALAERTSGVSFYVARKELYRHIIHDRYGSDDSQSGELVFFKRLNNTGFMVCYKANGAIYDYGFFPVINWREFLPVPGSFLR